MACELEGNHLSLEVAVGLRRYPGQYGLKDREDPILDPSPLALKLRIDQGVNQLDDGVKLWGKGEG